MRKNRIRLTENQLHKIIKESVKKVLKEAWGDDELIGPWARRRTPMPKPISDRPRDPRDRDAVKWDPNIPVDVQIRRERELAQEKERKRKEKAMTKEREVIEKKIDAIINNWCEKYSEEDKQRIRVELENYPYELKKCRPNRFFPYDCLGPTLKKLGLEIIY